MLGSRKRTGRGMLTVLGVNLGGEFLGGGLKPWKNKAEKLAEKIRHQNSPRHSPAISLKFVRQAKL